MFTVSFSADVYSFAGLASTLQNAGISAATIHFAPSAAPSESLTSIVWPEIPESKKASDSEESTTDDEDSIECEFLENFDCIPMEIDSDNE